MARRRASKRSGEIVSYWQSYSDMMAALLLMFVLIMALTLLRSLSTYEQKEKQLEEAREQAVEQQVALEVAQERVEEQQKQIDELIGVRTELIRALSLEFKNSDMQVTIDPQTGAIAFDASVLFDTGEYEIKPSGERFLKEFIPKYFRVVLNEEFSQYVAEIIIEGHTDTVGTYAFNLQLSQQRAYAVAEFCLIEADLEEFDKERIYAILTANGRSFSNPVLDTDGEVNLEASRRVEFKFRLKEDEMIQQMKEILEG